MGRHRRRRPQPQIDGDLATLCVGHPRRQGAPLRALSLGRSAGRDLSRASRFLCGRGPGEGLRQRAASQGRPNEYCGMLQYSHWGVQLREVAMAAAPTTTVNVRYMVDDVDAAVAWYTQHLGFKLLSNAAPAFADVTLGSLRLLLSGPKSSAGRPMPDGDRPGPGGWNRIHLIVDDISAEVARLRAGGVEFRNDIVSGPGGSQILLKDPSGNLAELFQPARRRLRGSGTGEARLASQLATAAGAARKLRVAYQSRCRLLLYPGLCAVCGRITNWRSPFGSCRKKSMRSSVVELPSWMPRIMSTGKSTFLGSTSGRLAAMSR